MAVECYLSLVQKRSRLSQRLRSQSLEKGSFQKRQSSGGYSTEFNTGRLHPAVKHLILLYADFDWKDTPFVHPPSTNGMLALSHT